MSPNLRTHGRSFLAYSTLMLLAGLFFVANAAAADELRTETVTFQDLSVDTSGGVKSLYNRIHAAAQRVCADNRKFEQTHVAECTRKAEARAVEKINAPLLTALYQMKVGAPTETLTAKLESKKILR